MNFRKLIEQAMFELRDEFAVLVAKKLEELIGPSDATKPVKAGATKKRGPKSKAAKDAKAPKGKARRTRAAGAHMDDLRTKVLHALRDGAPRKRAQILADARLGVDEAVRVASMLRKLKDEGKVSMRGTKASATYTRVDAP